MKRRQFTSLVTASLGRAFLPGTRAQSLPRDRPNIVWITGEDMGPQLGCYGYPLVRTPNLDRFAAEGVRFTRAFTTSPVCSASRSAFNTGMYQTTIGAHHHRSHRNDGYRLPTGVHLVAEYLRSAGYFTANVLEIAPNVRGTGKTDFNFRADHPYDGTRWNQRRPGQPFFSHVNFDAAHKGPAFTEARKQKYLVDPAKIPLPAYYPDHPVVRDEFANYLDAISLLDKQVGALLQALEKEGLSENTVVFFFADNGRCLLRGKVWLYDPGIHVPLIVRWPGVLPKASIREDIVSAIDFTATTLWVAGLEIPESVQGRPVFGPHARPRDMIFGARDRCGEAVDRIRCVRTHHYKYIRNFMPEKPYTQPHRYVEENYPTLAVLKALSATGKLTQSQAVFMQPRKPVDELYDLLADPDEVNNLATSPEHEQIHRELRQALENWIEESDDQGRFPESPSAVS